MASRAYICCHTIVACGHGVVASIPAQLDAAVVLRTDCIEWLWLNLSAFVHTACQAKVGVVRLRLNVLRAMLGRTGMQLLTVPLLTLSVAILLLLHCGVLDQV
jgi:hypothetical protein